MRIDELMARTGVKFGTSGARGLAADMTDRVCYAYTLGFLQYLTQGGAVMPGSELGIAGDLRPSSERIMNACARAVVDFGLRPRNYGRIPTPALAAHAIARGLPSLMVTGSHIPDDRNGIKFNLPSGEILKPDEEGIRAQDVPLPEDRFDAAGAFRPGAGWALPAAEATAYDAYRRRYLDFFPAGCLNGLRVGCYEHSSVAREALAAVLGDLGAQVERLGYSPTFVPVDTEAIRPEDQALARAWAGEGGYDALVSADGDGDRPLVADERGEWLRGDIAGILCARDLGVRALATPVSSNTAVERSGWFDAVLRTRIGSPYVIAGMQTLVAEGWAPVAGYEANGGFLLAADVREGDRVLPALPTRDALIVALAILRMAKRQAQPVSRLTFPTELSKGRLASLVTGDPQRDKAAVEAVLGAAFGRVEGLDTTDGLRVTFASGEIAHLRPSGNAPELRAYTEADSPERAQTMNRICLDILAGWRG